MGYGIKIINSSGRTQINTDEGYSLLYAGPAGSAVATGAFPQASWTGTNFILARPFSTATGSQGNGWARIGRDYNGLWGRGQTSFPNANNGNGGGSVVWRELKAQSDSSLTPSGYGLVAYDGGGTASTNIVFSATDLDVTCELMATGTFAGTSGSGTNADPYYTSYTIPVAGADRGQYYGLVTNCQQQYISGGMGNNTRIHIDYEFNYTAGTIRALCFQSTGTTFTALTKTLPYAIFRVRNGGTTDSTFS
jgi:hypothetical protein